MTERRDRVVSEERFREVELDVCVFVIEDDFLAEASDTEGLLLAVRFADVHAEHVEPRFDLRRMVGEILYDVFHIARAVAPSLDHDRVGERPSPARGLAMSILLPRVTSRSVALT